jgi:hypothetical protein
MIEILVGFAIGAISLTDKGRDLGNKISSAAMEAGKKVLKYAEEQKSAEQPTGTAGDAGDNC